MNNTINHHDIHYELVEAVRRQDRTAQFELYNLYAKAMLNTSFRIVRDLAEAEDVVQESFVKAFHGIEKFRGDSTFGSWLKRIVVNGALNALKRKKELADIDEEGVELVEDVPIDCDGLNLDQIKAAVTQLPDGFRLVFTLYMIEGYDHKEIAEIMEITESTSKSQLNRAKVKLRELLKTMYSYER
ncbi:RNA polymerase sigma factor [Reichenbachiella agarivorans]|uniref:RNA polymerase sigma factor n=1 Tax=Reichenbachiella agarivorans TaxID=2979464 RepID=A0ABY6CPM3_9BACT|nr:RNA polymerase sigma factor [Reichenbachiella agarivorans]UXP32461.1 RNA polymerase sigma factor [Reichenbachiella agarivorans]